MESINLRHFLAAIGLTAVMSLLGAMLLGGYLAPAPSYAEVTEDHVKVYEPATEAACKDSDLAESISYDGYDDYLNKDRYSMPGLRWLDSYAIGIKSIDKDEMLAEVMDELCGNPSAVYAAINGLDTTMKSLNSEFDFMEANPWAAEYVSDAEKYGIDHFLMEDQTTKQHRKTAEYVNTLLLHWENTGVVIQQETIANWADNGYKQSLALPTPAPRNAQEDLPALKLSLSGKGIGCVAAIGFNLTDQRFEILPCESPGAPASEPAPQEVTVVPSEEPTEPEPTEPTEEPEPTPTEEPTEPTEPEPTEPTEEPEPTEPEPTEPTEEPEPTEPEPTEPTEPEPTEPTEEPEPTPTEEPTEPTEPEPEPEEPTEPMPTSKDSDDSEWDSDGSEADSGEDRPEVEETEEASEPEPVETETTHESNGVTDSSTKKPGSETGITAPGADEPESADPEPDDPSSSAEPDSGDSTQGDEDDSLQDEATDKPDKTKPTQDPDPVVVDNGPVNNEEVVNPF